MATTARTRTKKSGSTRSASAKAGAGRKTATRKPAAAKNGNVQAALLKTLMIDCASANIMFADRDLVLRYVNPAAIATLDKIRDILPIPPETMLGQNIDIFHKVPERQRKLLGDPKNLPYRAEINLGKEMLSLAVSAVYDDDGEYLGPMVAWDIITEQKLRNADFQSQVEAIGRSQAVIEFNMDGTIRTANENFLKTLGYTLDEIKGKHHSMFVPADQRNSPEYRQHWEQLKHGQHQGGEFERVGRNGESVWIQATYNPIFDLAGEPFKVVKYATDITAEKKRVAETQRKVDIVLSLVNSVAEGHFDLEVPNLGTDAVGQVADALSRAINSIRSTLQEVQSVSSIVATAANQMTGASTEISSGAQKQAARLEETASSLEEITSTVKQNSDNAQQARQLANSSRDVAENGGSVVGDAVTAMSEINESSKKIADIITTIDEIAFQTNLLALNAAVEAARAGEQGRGFAVVAAEVRNLAQRSASSAKEIKSLIQDSVSKVTRGTELVNKSGETLGEIVGSVKRVTDIVAEIAAASREQLTGIEQVNKAMNEMDRVTQSNANQTEEMSGTAASLLSHARQLDQLVSRFRLGAETLAPAAQPGRLQSPAPAGHVAPPAPARRPAPAAGNDFLEF
ncbi:MAG: PAS domain-containing protein [Planctomycetaceae bacterium]|nr:PAS domain-containing protein [Planctomycetaceae bacterium]